MKAVSEKEECIEGWDDFEIDGTKLSIHISRDEVAALLSAYDPDDFNSPDVATCRALARLILDALNS